MDAYIATIVQLVDAVLADNIQGNVVYEELRELMHKIRKDKSVGHFRTYIFQKHTNKFILSSMFLGKNNFKTEERRNRVLNQLSVYRQTFVDNIDAELTESWETQKYPDGSSMIIRPDEIEAAFQTAIESNSRGNISRLSSRIGRSLAIDYGIRRKLINHAKYIDRCIMKKEPIDEVLVIDNVRSILAASFGSIE